MSKVSLAIALSNVPPFEEGDASLEQYSTDSELAASMLWEAYMQGDIEGKVVADFGAGTGILSVGCAILGAEQVISVEKDEKAISLLKKNVKEYGVKIKNEDVADFSKKVDTIVMNPPFGVQARKADKVFLEMALKHASVVYWLGKKEGKRFAEAVAREHGKRVTHRWEYMLSLKNTMKHHTKKTHDVEVLWCRIA